MARLVAEETFRAKRDQAAADPALRVRAKVLGGQPVWLRPRSYDWAAFDFAHRGYHLPPDELAGPVEHVAVFGANIGLLAADLAARYPDARLLAVEPDLDNAALARRNLARLGERCTLVEAAVWYREEQLAFRWERDAWGQILSGSLGQDGSAGVLRVDAVDAGKLLGTFVGQAPVDYLLINIETAWYEMLRHGEWADNVRCIKIEIQDHYDEAVPLLQAMGYQAWLQRLNWGAFATGIRL